MFCSRRWGMRGMKGKVEMGEDVIGAWLAPMMNMRSIAGVSTLFGDSPDGGGNTGIIGTGQTQSLPRLSHH